MRVLARKLTQERYGAGQTVVREGESGDRCFFVVSGRVEFSVGHSEERTVVGGTGTRGYFGELALVLPSGLRQATVTALTEVECLSLKAEAFLAALKAHQEAGTELERHARAILVARFLGEAAKRR